MLKKRQRNLEEWKESVELEKDVCSLAGKFLLNLKQDTFYSLLYTHSVPLFRFPVSGVRLPVTGFSVRVTFR